MNKRQINNFIKKIKIDLLTGCWLWQAYLDGRGYGKVQIRNKWGRAHRTSYEYWNGKIPDDKEIDHLCRNKNCVNPRHLEAVTHIENVKRGNLGLINKNKTHCKWGHNFTEENTIITKSGKRRCRICVYQQNRNSKLRLKCH